MQNMYVNVILIVNQSAQSSLCHFTLSFPCFPRVLTSKQHGKKESLKLKAVGLNPAVISHLSAHTALSQFLNPLNILCINRGGFVHIPLFLKKIAYWNKEIFSGARKPAE